MELSCLATATPSPAEVAREPRRRGPCPTEGLAPGDGNEGDPPPPTRVTPGQVSPKGVRAGAQDVILTLNYENTLTGCFFCSLHGTLLGGCRETSSKPTPFFSSS